MSVDETDVNEEYFHVMAGGMAILNVIAFAAVGEFALESLSYGAIAGLFAGLGTYLFLPWFLRLQTTQSGTDDERPISEIARQVDRSAQLGVLGLGLEGGAIIMIVVAFWLGDVDFLLGGGAAVAVALIVYLAGAVLLDQ